MDADDERKGLCANCGKRPGTISWSDALAMTHGFGEMWCEVCAFETQLAHARERAAAIPELEAKLEAARLYRRPETLTPENASAERFSAAEDGAVGRELVPPAPPQPTGIKRLWLRWKWRGQWPASPHERLIRMRIEAEEAWKREAIAADELRDKLVAAEAREQRALDSRDTAIRQLDDARRQRDSERRRGNYWKKKSQATSPERCPTCMAGPSYRSTSTEHCPNPFHASTGKESS